MPNSIKLTAILFFTILTAGCGSETGKTKKENEVSKPAEQPVHPETTDTTTSLVIKVLPDIEGGIPQRLVLLSDHGKQTVIDTVNNCEPITNDHYADYDIPANASVACGGWYAGGGDYYYLVIRDGKPALFYGWQDEMQKDKGFHWHERKLP